MSMKDLVIRMYAAANAGDLDAVDDIFTADFRSHPMGTTGRQPVKYAWRSIRERHPGMRVVADDIVAEGDRIAVRASVHGTTTPPPVLMEMIRVSGGRIAELWAVTSTSLR